MKQVPKVSRLKFNTPDEYVIQTEDGIFFQIYGLTIIAHFYSDNSIFFDQDAWETALSPSMEDIYYFLYVSEEEFKEMVKQGKIMLKNLNT